MSQKIKYYPESGNVGFDGNLLVELPIRTKENPEMLKKELELIQSRCDELTDRGLIPTKLGLLVKYNEYVGDSLPVATKDLLESMVGRMHIRMGVLDVMNVVNIMQEHCNVTQFVLSRARIIADSIIEVMPELEDKNRTLQYAIMSIKL